MAVDVVMPQLGESVVEGTITRWLVKEGSAIQKDQPLVTISTDKADTDVPSPTSGVVVKLAVAEGETVKVNTVIAVIDAAASATTSAPAAAPAAAAPAVAASAADAGGQTSPAVRSLAREHNIDLATVRGTGENGRVTKQDVLDAAAKKPTVAMPALVAPAPVAVAAPSRVESANAVIQAASAVSYAAPTKTFKVPAYVPQPGDEVVPFSRRRRIIAEHMVYSKHVSPHVMTIAEIDMHKVHKLREAKKNELKAQGVNLTYLAFIAAATARALRENPVMNARVLDDAFVKLKRIHLGVAVETKDGLIVPVVRDADELTVRGLARAIDDVAAKARDGKTTPDDLAGATFSISNPGLKGNFVGAAIISQPNVGILRIGEMVKRPVVVEQDGQDMIAIHPVMFAALSYDHRIVDGVAANSFLFRVTELLEKAEFDV